MVLCDGVDEGGLYDTTQNGGTKLKWPMNECRVQRMRSEVGMYWWGNIGRSRTDVEPQIILKSKNEGVSGIIVKEIILRLRRRIECSWNWTGRGGEKN